MVWPDWFVAGIVVDLERGEVQIIEHRRDVLHHFERVQIRFPGSKQQMRNNRADLTPTVTLLAEVVPRILATDGRIISYRRIYVASRHQHEQIFYLLELEGPFQTEARKKQEKGRPLEEISPPRFMPVEEVVDIIFRSHLPALKALCEELPSERATFKRALERIKQREQREQREHT